MHPVTIRSFFTELSKIAAAMKIKSNDRMPPRTKSNIEALKNHIEGWNHPHREEAVKFMKDVSPEGLFDLLHSTRRWYTGQTMGHKLKDYRDSLKPVMKLDPEHVLGIYRGFKVPNDSPLAQARVGDSLILPVTRNRGLSSWSTTEAPTNRFSGGGGGKTGIIVRLAGTEGVTPLLAPPSHTEPWFNSLYEHAIGKSFRPTEGEYLIDASRVKVEVVKVKK